MPLAMLRRWRMATVHALPDLRLKDLVSHRIDCRQAATAYDLIDRCPQDIMQVVTY
jgi:hypothetical protein